MKRKNAKVEYLDYQIPVTQREMEICKKQSEIKMRHLPAVDDTRYSAKWRYASRIPVTQLNGDMQTATVTQLYGDMQAAK